MYTIFETFFLCLNGDKFIFNHLKNILVYAIVALPLLLENHSDKFAEAYVARGSDENYKNTPAVHGGKLNLFQ